MGWTNGTEYMKGTDVNVFQLKEEILPGVISLSMHANQNCCRILLGVHSMSVHCDVRYPTQLCIVTNCTNDAISFWNLNMHFIFYIYKLWQNSKIFWHSIKCIYNFWKQTILDSMMLVLFICQSAFWCVRFF